MTSGLLVSTEMNADDSRRNASNDRYHAIEFFTETGSGAGACRLTANVDDGRAFFDHAERVPQRDRAKRPPSEKESGVTLSTPITTGAPRSRFRSRHCQ